MQILNMHNQNFLDNYFKNYCLLMTANKDTERKKFTNSLFFIRYPEAEIVRWFLLMVPICPK